MKKTLFFVSGLLILTACSTHEGPKKGEVVSTIAAGGEEDARSIRENAALIAKEEAEAREAEKNVTSIAFDKPIHDFGEVATGSENKCVFKITNTGDKPLIIYNVGASCGCTTPKKPEHPIAPGKSDVLEVGFKPNGPGPSEKTVTVQANTNPRVSTVKIKALVK
jgi:hypothetical protein